MFSEVREKLENVEQMSCKPDFRKLPVGFITDENQSVKWNREQVELNNKNYLEEVKRLNTKKNKACVAAHEELYKVMQKELPVPLTKDALNAIWSYAYEKGHSYGVNEVLIHLEEVVEMVGTVLEGQVKK